MELVTSDEAKLLLTVTEAACLLSLGRNKTYELVCAGVIPSVRITESLPGRPVRPETTLVVLGWDHVMRCYPLGSGSRLAHC